MCFQCGLLVDFQTCIRTASSLLATSQTAAEEFASHRDLIPLTTAHCSLMFVARYALRHIPSSKYVSDM